MFSAMSMLARNFFVLLGHLAAIVTGVGIQGRGVVFVFAIVFTTVGESVGLLLK